MTSIEINVLADHTNQRQARKVRDTRSSAALVAKFRDREARREYWVRGVDEAKHGHPFHLTHLRGYVYCDDRLMTSPQLKRALEGATEYDVVHKRSDQPMYVTDANI